MGPSLYSTIFWISTGYIHSFPVDADDNDDDDDDDGGGECNFKPFQISS